MFSGCTGLITVDDGFLPEIVTYKENNASSEINLGGMFAGCTKLKSACINITNIADSRKHVRMN